jgi:hypothetical protein
MLAFDYQMIVDKIQQMIYDSKPINLEEKGEIIHLLNDTRMRIAVTEVMQEISAPRKVTDIECLKLIGDIIRFILTLFVHEGLFDFEFMGAVLNASHQVYFINNHRKVFLR